MTEGLGRKIDRYSLRVYQSAYKRKTRFNAKYHNYHFHVINKQYIHVFGITFQTYQYGVCTNIITLVVLRAQFYSCLDKFIMLLLNGYKDINEVQSISI